MLSGLSIRNVVLIESLDLDLEGGLTALTGETGAGKSIILDALTMASGARSDKGLVRKGSPKAQCTASFILTEDHPAWTILTKADFDLGDSQELILRRVISADGRSKAYINDTPVSVRLLSDLGRELVEIHGQHDGRGLLDPSQHIMMLDAFGDYSADIENVRASYKAMIEAQGALDDIKARAEQAEADRDFFAFAVEELDRLDVRANEDQELASRRKLLQGAEGALNELMSAETALGDGEYEARLSAALAGIERVKSKVGPDQSQAYETLQQAVEALERSVVEIEEARQAVNAAASIFHLEPGELDRTEQRLFAIKAACRKYGVDASQLIEKRREFVGQLALLENLDDELNKAAAELERTKQAYNKAAVKLSKLRAKAGKALESAVHKELPSLKMENAKFNCTIEAAPDSPTGRDKVRFVVATNPGSAPGPMDKVASGGELSRFALAIKVALAVPEHKVMIFDEVDQGVGGAVASAVGQRLSSLAGDGQIFIVTHSPQVAACADHQYRIVKSSTATATTTTVIQVAEDSREEEIARMLAGEHITDEARAAARQLMKAS